MKMRIIIGLLVCFNVAAFAQKDSIKKPVVKYEVVISKGDLAMGSKDYLTAKRFYQQALTVKPDDSYAKAQVDVCDKKMWNDNFMTSDWDCPCHNGKINKNASNDAEVTTADTMVHSVFPGKVSSVSTDSGSHTIILIKHGKYSATYSNLSGALVKPGDEIKEGDKIGFFTMSKGPYTLKLSIWCGRQKDDPSKYVRCKQ